MKFSIDVKNRKEGEAIRQGLEDKMVRAFVVTIGALKALPTDRSRKRVLQFVVDYFDEHRNRAWTPDHLHSKS